MRMPPISKRTWFTILAAVAVVVVVKAAAGIIKQDRVALEVFHATDSAFSVSLPPRVNESTQTVDTRIGVLVFHTLQAKARYIRFIMNYTDYPPQYIADTDPGVLLDGVVAGALSNYSGKQVKKSAFTYRGYEAREVKIKAPKRLFVRCRIVLVGSRVYQIMALTTRRHIDDRKVRDAFDSFTVAGPATQSP